MKLGRPPKFESPEELQEAVELYLDSTPQQQYTVTGLALSIGTTRETLDDYQEKEGYKHIIKRAKLIVENSYELSLRKNGRTGDIFALKNFGWKDKHESEITNPDGSLNPMNSLTAEELRKLAGK